MDNRAVDERSAESVMSKVGFRRDLMLYGAIGGLSAAQACVASGELPKNWSAPIVILLAALIAVKAKLSQGKSNNIKEEN